MYKKIMPEIYKKNGGNTDIQRHYNSTVEWATYESEKESHCLCF